MPAETVTARWECVLDKIRELIPPHSFNTWFMNSAIERFDDEVISIGTANIIVKGWIDKNYSSIITDIVQTLYGITPQINVFISPEKFQQMRRTQNEDVPVSASVRSPRRSKDYSFESNKSFRLDNFITGESNSMALAAVKNAVDCPGEYNPLFLHSAHGMGKSHLLQGMCRYKLEKDADAKVLCISGEQFYNRFQSALFNKTLDSFRNIFRKCDMLVIDDVHFIAQGNKAATQEQLLYTFDKLLDAGKQIVLASDKQPEDIIGLSDRLRSRFSAGLSVKINDLDDKLLQEIVATKSRARGIEVPKNLLGSFVRDSSASVRDIEGVVGRVTAMQKLAGLELTQENISSVVGKKQVSRRQTMDDVAKACAAEFKVTLAELKGRKRTSTVSLARKIAVQLCRLLTSASLQDIGEYFGKRSHATIISTIKIPAVKICDEDYLRQHIESIATTLDCPDAPADFFKQQAKLF